jgi:hypothetical protein
VLVWRKCSLLTNGSLKGSFQKPVQKRRLILHSSSTLFGAYVQMLSPLLPGRSAKKKTYHALLFDSPERLFPDVVFSFTSPMCKKRLFLHYSSTLVGFISRCCISFTSAMCKKGLSFSPLRLSLAFISICCLLFH